MDRGLVRVFEIPAPTGHFHFGGGEPQTFVEVDWFRDDHESPDCSAACGFGAPEGRVRLIEWIKRKRYYHGEKDYLVLHPLHPLVIPGESA